MTNSKKAAPAGKAPAAPKALKKLIPRTAPALEAAAVTATEPPAVLNPGHDPVASRPEMPATAAATATVRPPRKPSKEDETVAMHQKVLAEALEMAQAIKYDQPKLMKQEAVKSRKAAKSPKVKKVKLVRDCFAMPEGEYVQIGELKKRLAGMGGGARKSEIVRGGIAVLAALNDAELKAVMARIERIKTGRPAK